MRMLRQSCVVERFNYITLILTLFIFLLRLKLLASSHYRATTDGSESFLFLSISIQTMSTGRSTAHTCVFWDVQDFPVPNGRDPDSIYENIKSALANKGFGGGIVHIRAYGDKVARVSRMIKDVLLWALDNRVHPSVQRNVMVISKNIAQDLEFLSVLQGLQSRDYKILLADVASVKQPEFVSAEWLWRSLLDGGGDPIATSDEISPSVNDDDDNLKRKDHTTAKATDKRSSKHKRRKFSN